MSQKIGTALVPSEVVLKMPRSLYDHIKELVRQSRLADHKTTLFEAIEQHAVDIGEDLTKDELEAMSSLLTELATSKPVKGTPCSVTMTDDQFVFVQAIANTLLEPTENGWAHRGEPENYYRLYDVLRRKNSKFGDAKSYSEDVVAAYNKYVSDGAKALSVLLWVP